MNVFKGVTAEEINAVAEQMIVPVSEESAFLVGLAALDVAQWVAHRSPSPYREALAECFGLALESLKTPTQDDIQH